MHPCEGKTLRRGARRGRAPRRAPETCRGRSARKSWCASTCVPGWLPRVRSPPPERPPSRRPLVRGGEPRLGRTAARERDLGGDADRLEEVPVVGHVLARDVEGRPVPGRGPDERQPDEQRHHLAEAEQLHGHEPLVVVEREGQVDGTVACPEKNGVRRERALGIDAARARRRDRGYDLVPLLAAEGALLARGWVESRDREPRPRDAQVRSEERR